MSLNSLLQQDINVCFYFTAITCPCETEQLRHKICQKQIEIAPMVNTVGRVNNISS